jgi:hypothetical protein
MHVYLWVMFVLFVAATFGSIVKFNKFGGKGNLFIISGNVALLVWTAVLLWS